MFQVTRILIGSSSLELLGRLEQVYFKKELFYLAQKDLSQRMAFVTLSHNDQCLPVNLSDCFLLARPSSSEGRLCIRIGHLNALRITVWGWGGVCVIKLDLRLYLIKLGLDCSNKINFIVNIL